RADDINRSKFPFASRSRSKSDSEWRITSSGSLDIGPAIDPFGVEDSYAPNYGFHGLYIRALPRWRHSHLVAISNEPSTAAHVSVLLLFTEPRNPRNGLKDKYCY